MVDPNGKDDKWYLTNYGKTYDCNWLKTKGKCNPGYDIYKGFGNTVSGSQACSACGGGSCEYSEDSSDAGQTGHYLGG